MTNKQIVENYKVLLSIMTDAKYSHPKNESVIDPFGITIIRRSFINHFRNEICSLFYSFERWTSFDVPSIDNVTWISNTLNKAVRNFYGNWFLVDIVRNIGGIITTDAPDNYPYHCFPKKIKAYSYPELAMIEAYFSLYPEKMDEEGYF